MTFHRRIYRSRARRRGFTLMEVMVALAILAIAMSAVFSAEAGAVRMAARARKTGWAAMLVRCKMGEIEEQILSEGFPALFDEGTDNCCEDAKIEGYTCKWEIEPVSMPDTMFEGEDKDGDGMPDGPENGDPEGSKADAKGGAAVDSKGLLEDEDTPKDKKKLDTAAILKDPKKLLGGSASGSETDGEGGGAPDMDAIASMAMGYVYPILKPSFESQIRRATVAVTWKEGDQEKSFDVTQYLVAEQPIVMPDGTDPNAQGTDSSGSGTPGTGTGTGSGTKNSGSSIFGTTK